MPTDLPPDGVRILGRNLLKLGGSYLARLQAIHQEYPKGSYGRRSPGKVSPIRTEYVQWYLD